MKEESSMKQQFLGTAYRIMLKPVFFLCDPEQVHNFMTDMGSLLGKSFLTRQLIKVLFYVGDRSLGKKIDGIFFPNPVGLAAGFDYEAKLLQILPEVGFGFMTVGTVTFQPYEGNPTPRLQRFPKSKSLLINKGFKSPGAFAIIEKLSGRIYEAPFGISVGSTNTFFKSQADQIKDIKKTFRLFEKSTVTHSYYELNISCPNTKGGQPFTTPERLEDLLSHVDLLRITKPIYIKMPIDLGEKETLRLLKVADKHQVQGVIFGNLTKDKKNPDIVEEDRQKWMVSAGNLSGKPTWNRSNTLIALTKKNFGKRFTIIGTGGVFSPEDAKRKLALGADLVQLITGMIFQGPQLIGEINSALMKSEK